MRTQREMSQTRALVSRKIIHIENKLKKNEKKLRMKDPESVDILLGMIQDVKKIDLEKVDILENFCRWLKNEVPEFKDIKKRVFEEAVASFCSVNYTKIDSKEEESDVVEMPVPPPTP